MRLSWLMKDKNIKVAYILDHPTCQNVDSYTTVNAVNETYCKGAILRQRPHDKS